jgi:hypothetical protein
MDQDSDPWEILSSLVNMRYPKVEPGSRGMWHGKEYSDDGSPGMTRQEVCAKLWEEGVSWGWFGIRGQRGSSHHKWGGRSEYAVHPKEGVVESIRLRHKCDELGFKLHIDNDGYHIRLGRDEIWAHQDPDHPAFHYLLRWWKTMGLHERGGSGYDRKHCAWLLLHAYETGYRGRWDQGVPTITRDEREQA